MTRRLFLTADAVGGVWQYATELTRALAPLGYQVTVALLGPPPSPAQRGALDGATLVETGLALDWVAADAATVLETGAAIARLAEAHRADIVQLNQPALAAGGAFAMPLVAVAHSCVGTWWRAARGDAPEPADFAWQTALMQRGLAQADAIVAPSHAFAAALQARYALPAAPLAVHNGRSPICTSPGPIHDFAFTAGRLWDEGKGIATLDRAAARLSVPFKAAGPLTGPNGQSIEVANLYAPGPLSDGSIADCLCARPVFVSAARYEPFGLAVLEAALAGCPLVLADTPVFRELWDGAALFVDAEDDAGFAAAVERIVGDVPLRIAQGDLARARGARFTPARMAAGMDAVFTGILDGRAQRAAA